MYLRLAFAVAAHVEPDIVIVDEVLAVGDVQFRERCLGRMSEFGNDGRTVVFVSHDSGVEHQLCSRALWIEGGRLRLDGATSDVLDAYLRASVQEGAEASFPADEAAPVRLRTLAVVDPSGRPLATVRRDEPFELRVRFATTRRVLGLDVAVSIQTRHGVPVLDEVLSDADVIGAAAQGPGEWEARLAVPPILSAGEYFAGVWLGTGGESFFTSREALSFRLLPSPGDRPDAVERTRVLTAPGGWRVEPAGGAER